MTREEMFEDIDALTVGLDDTFKFHCTQCGKCCRNRTDILLSAYDIFKMSKYLKMAPQEFFNKYCRWHIGDNSRVPIIRLNSVGKDDRCPMLVKNKCSVHPVKPSVCALFPMGRYIVVNADKEGAHADQEYKVNYLIQPIECGNESETHTVREWLTGFDIQIEDEVFILWHTILMKLGDSIRELEQKVDPVTMLHVWNAMRIFMYLEYDTEDEFLPQLRKNASMCSRLLERVSQLSGGTDHAG